MVRKVVLALASMVALVLPAGASLPDPTAPIRVASIARPDDGANYVWQVFCKSGLTYSYIPASQFPLSPRFEEVSAPQTGDIAWWPEFVAIYVAQNSSYITSAGFVRVADLGGSTPHYYRMRVLPGEAPGSKNATCERNLL